jgi:Flp pilus assembly protein TadG
MMLKRKSGQRGVGVVEFALILPIILVVLYGVFEFGLAFWRKQVLTSAVREGARKGIVATNPRKTCAQVQDVVSAYLDNVGWDSSKGTYLATGGCASGTAGDSLTVTADYPSSFLVLSKLGYSKTAVDGDGNVILTATVVMQME